MSDIDQPETGESSSSAGGAAASAGIRFQQQLGALAQLWILAGIPLDHRFNLGSARAESVRFETEAPVDDILVATSEGGYVAIQAKTSASLSSDPRSAFGKTVDQFVRHWRASHNGNGDYGWDRPLDPTRDRLVLAVGPSASASVRTELAAALKARSEGGGTPPTQAQARALADFDALVASSWINLSTEPIDPQIHDDLAGLVVVYTFDPDGADKRQFELIASSLIEHGDGRTLQGSLSHIAGQLMARRGGVDLPLLRRELSANGIRLAAAPQYQHDVAALRAHTAEVLASLARYEVIEGADHKISVTRDCQRAVTDAALGGSLLITGEPGSGKSAVLNTLARQLQADGHDVVELAVDRYSVESLEGLGQELKLQNNLLDVLDAWDGDQPAWLIIDALDATRGGRGEGAFRTLISRVLERKGRWRVVASIRSFDLRMGQQFRALFPGPPPVQALSEAGFRGVRHIRVPAWSPSEFGALLEQSPPLRAALAGASSRLLELASVPFNTRLISDLLSDTSLNARLSNVASQAQLLGLYWDYRVSSHGAPALAALHRVVTAMVGASALRASVLEVSQSDPATVDTLCSEGVLIRVEGDRWVQFRHHLLFDYSAARLLFEPSQVVTGERRFPKEDALGLMLAPALTFLLQEVWESETDRDRFWIAIGNLVSDPTGDPIIRSAAGRQSAEYPTVPGDTLVLARQVSSGDEKAAAALSHIAGALAIRLEDDADVPLEPWIVLVGALAPSADRIATVLRFLVMLLLDRTTPAVVSAEVGLAARALLRHGLDSAETNNLVATTIPYVIDTYGTDPTTSRALLTRVFGRERLLQHGSDEAPAVCRKIAELATADPAFAALIYVWTFAFSVTDDRKTHMSGSQILSLTSNARQDYGMAQYALNEHIEVFLQRHPREATEAVIGAVDGYVARAHPIRGDNPVYEVSVGPQTVRLQADQSYIWAHDAGARYGHDGDVLIAKFYNHLRSIDVVAAISLARHVAVKAWLAVMWSRLFMAGAARDDQLVDFLWPYAASEVFLVVPDTRKDAVDVVAAGYNRRSLEERTAFEASVFKFDFSIFSDPPSARDALLSRVFGAIGRGALVSDDARALAPLHLDQGKPANARLFEIRGGSRQMGAYDWIDDLDKADVTHSTVIEGIEVTKRTFGLETSKAAPADLTLSVGLDVLEALAILLDQIGVPDGLIRSGFGAIAQGCERILKAELIPTTAGAGEAERFIRLLKIAGNAPYPKVDEETERRFEEDRSWGGPAPRVDAAEVMLKACLARPDFYPILTPDIDRLLNDAHPAVRQQAALNLVKIWDLDRDGFWHRVGERLNSENNLGVLALLIGGIIGTVLHADPALSEESIFQLLARFAGGSGRSARVGVELSDKVCILWVTYQRARAYDQLVAWIADPIANHEILCRLVSTLRDAAVAGFREEDDQDIPLRHRSQAIIGRIVEAASQRLAPLIDQGHLTDLEAEQGRNLAQILDIACQELYFASGVANGQKFPEGPGPALFLSEIAPILTRIGDLATPHTVYNLLQLIEGLAGAGPEVAFDVAAHALLTGGTKSGYQFDHMGVEVMVRLVGTFLADHKDIFEAPARRAELIDCLETFMEAGWPAARRLLYRLPELIQ